MCEVRYQVILTIDVFEKYYGTALSRIKPAVIKYPLFQVTEDKPDPDYSEKVHRKYVGIINGNQLKELIEQAEFDDICETMGSLTIIGLLPAISFTNTYETAYSISAYISPLIAVGEINKDLKSLPEPQKEKIYKYVIEPTYENLMNILRKSVECSFDEWETFTFPSEIDINSKQLFLEM